jgi:hypothetical protein
MNRVDLNQALFEIENYRADTKDPAQGPCLFSPGDANRLSRDLSDPSACMITRRVLEYLGSDESVPFRWKLDHKLIQYEVLNKYFPELLPKTSGLVEAHLHSGDGTLESYLQKEFPGGFVVKSTRGSGAERQVVLNSSREMLPTLNVDSLKAEYDGDLESERYFVQALVPVAREYRVHTLGREVVKGLTFCTHGARQPTIPVGERLDVEAMVRTALEVMPEGLCTNSVCGWDIGMKADNSFQIFELNYSGHHPVSRPGFQCSAFLGNSDSGSFHNARLMYFISNTLGVTFAYDFDGITNDVEAVFAREMARVRRWMQLLRLTDDVLSLWKGIGGEVIPGYSSLRKQISDNKATNADHWYVGFVDSLKRLTDDLR